MKEVDYQIRIQNLKQYIVNIPSYHPSDPRYLSFQKTEKQKCIEGMQGKEVYDDKIYYRYMSGKLYFYGNYQTIIDTDSKEKTRQNVRPSIRDLEQHRSYNLLVAQGFSGFELDDEYSCDEALINEDIMLYAQKLPERVQAFTNTSGKLKKYISAQQYVSKLHDKPLGKPLYWNSAKNIPEAGSRSGGKSYQISGISAHELLFDGAKYYDPENINTNRKQIFVCIGSGNTDKSAELCLKVKNGIDELASDKRLGVFGDLSDDNFEPNPFFKNMIGDVSPNNKDNAYRHEYTIIKRGNKFTRGSRSSLYHVSYSTQKKGGGAESAAGGRYNLSVVEESGITSNVKQIHYSNKATVRTDTEQFGVEIYIGTSGNMELFKEFAEIFFNPEQFNCISFPDYWEGKGQIGFFIPAYMVDMKFKDQDGNTDLLAAKSYYEKELAKSKSSEEENAMKMNQPLLPSHMLITKAKSILPKSEAEKVKRNLLMYDNYKKERTIVNLYFDSNQRNSIGYEIIPENKANVFDNQIDTQGHNSKKNERNKSTDTDIIIYEFPDPNAPSDMYKFIGIDTYVTDDEEEGESLGCIYVLKSPKYISEGYTGDIIVAEYIGKPHGSRDKFNEIAEKLAMFYNNTKRSLMFEANRGDDFKEYFTKRKKEMLLALSPFKYTDQKVQVKQKLSYGVLMNNQFDKVKELNELREQLLTDTTFIDKNTGQPETKKNIERIKSVGFLDEIINYDRQSELEKKSNYDRISAFICCLVARRESYNELIQNETKNKTNPLEFLAKNSALKRVRIHGVSK